MKQFTIIVEVLSGEVPTILIRDPRSGNVIKIFNSCQDVSEFIYETNVKLNQQEES